MNDPRDLAQRLCDDPSLESTRAAALVRTRLEFAETQNAVLSKDRNALAAILRRSVHDEATIMHASMHARVCPDCADIEAILDDGAAALARQAISWWGFWGSFRAAPGVPTTTDRLTTWLAAEQPALLARLDAAFDALATA